MTNNEKNEWRRWWQFFVKRVREIGFVAAWVMMSWSLHTYIVRPFPLEGSPKYMLRVFEGVFNIYMLRELVAIVIWPHKLPIQHWLRKISRGRRTLRDRRL